MDAIPLPPVLALSLAWQPLASRPALAALFALDTALAAAMARAREPLLAQVRLAWWRDRLNEGPSAWQGSDPALCALADGWKSGTNVLVGLVDGWEELLGEAPLDPLAFDRFAAARGAALATIAGDPAAAIEGRRWAHADLAARVTHPDERAAARALGAGLPPPARLARAMRGIAVLGALCGYALAKDQEPGAGRGAALLALRVGSLGR
jgi:phytoene synthase